MPLNIVTLAIINRSNQLLGIHVTNDQQHLVQIESYIFSLLETIDEKEKTKTKYPDAYLGLVNTLDDTFYHAYVTNTGTKLILAIRMYKDSIVKGSEIRNKFREFSELYSNLLLDTSYILDHSIPNSILEYWNRVLSR